MTHDQFIAFNLLAKNIKKPTYLQVGLKTVEVGKTNSFKHAFLSLLQNRGQIVLLSHPQLPRENKWF